MATDLEKLMLTHYTDNEIHVTPEQKFILDQEIGSLMEGFTLIQSDFAYVDTILANAIASESIFADFIDTELLEADKILASTIEATYLYTMHMDAEVANITSLFANYATIENLTATRAEIDVLLADYIKADSIIANDLSASTILADAATISSLLSFNISTEGLASLRITSDQIVVADGFINDAMIMELSANKIKAGSIYTNLVNIVSESGNLGIMDNTIQIKDDMDTTRVQIGKDADEDYSMYVWDAAGNLMFDATGLHADGIKHPIIRDDMVSDLANISGHKLNIESVITEINDGSTTLKSSKIYFDEDEQTLDVKLGSITSLVDDAASEVSTLRTDVQVAQGSINTIISETDMATIEGLGTTFYEQYNTTKSTVDSWEVSLGNQETTFPGLINSVKTNNAKISATPEAISAVLTSEYMDTLGTIQAIKTSIALTQGAIEAKVSKNGVIAAINLEPGTAKIYASKINLVGAVTVLSDLSGKLGTITAGTINGVTINSTTINSTDINGGTITGTTIKTNDTGFIDRLELSGNELTAYGITPIAPTALKTMAITGTGISFYNNDYDALEEHVGRLFAYEHKLQIDGNVKFRKNVEVTGDVSVAGWVKTSSGKNYVYLYASGTNWKQYSDGTMVVEVSKSVSGSISKVWGSLYYLTVGSISFPRTFIGTPSVTFTNTSGRGVMFGYTIVNPSSINTVELYRPDADTQSYTYSFKVRAVGIWR